MSGELAAWDFEIGDLLKVCFRGREPVIGTIVKADKLSNRRRMYRFIQSNGQGLLLFETHFSDEDVKVEKLAGLKK